MRSFPNEAKGSWEGQKENTTRWEKGFEALVTKEARLVVDVSRFKDLEQARESHVAYIARTDLRFYTSRRSFS